LIFGFAALIAEEEKRRLEKKAIRVCSVETLSVMFSGIPTLCFSPVNGHFNFVSVHPAYGEIPFVHINTPARQYLVSLTQQRLAESISVAAIPKIFMVTL
jgi:hypothetical protein